MDNYELKKMLVLMDQTDDMNLGSLIEWYQSRKGIDDYGDLKIKDFRQIARDMINLARRMQWLMHKHNVDDLELVDIDEIWDAAGEDIVSVYAGPKDRSRYGMQRTAENAVKSLQKLYAPLKFEASMF